MKLGTETYREMCEISSHPGVRESVSFWVEQYDATREAAYLDIAQAFCEERDIPLPPTLQTLVKKYTLKRAVGDAVKGSPHKVLKEIQISAAFKMIMGLRWAGANLNEAARKTARFMFDKAPEFAIKAATLERRYSSAFRRTLADGYTLEQLCHQRLDDPSMRKVGRRWKVLRNTLQDCSEEQAGADRHA